MKIRPAFGAFILAVLLCSGLARGQEQNRVVMETRSDFQSITVWDTPENMRQLIFDAKGDGTDAIQSQMNKARPDELTLDYARHMIASIPAAAKPNHILVVGLGGACIQRYLRGLLPQMVIESAELDPAVLQVAKQCFYLKVDDHQKVHVGDGRKFIEQSKDKYDVIMLDAFSATSIPYLLATKEFLAACKEHLTDGGVVCANLWYESPDYQDMLKTYDAVFAEWHVMKCTKSTNAILLALPDKRGFTGEKWIGAANAFEKAHSSGMDLPKMIENDLEAQTTIRSAAKVLLDADADKHK